MRDLTRRLWAKQDQHAGDRELFRAVAAHVDATTVLYPGSYVDLAASLVWPSVTYVDVDRRAARFFEDGKGWPSSIASTRCTRRSATGSSSPPTTPIPSASRTRRTTC